MKNLIILTSNFPFEGGEQFIETEIKYWGNTKFDNVYLLPNGRAGKKRFHPHTITVLSTKGDGAKIGFVFLSFFKSVFYSEIFYILKNTQYKHWFSNATNALKTTAILLKQKRKLKHSLKELKNNENFIYSYWNEADSYAACLLKREGLISKVFSRVHRFDLYEDGRKFEYMPLKRQFVDDFDRVYLLSKKAKKYFAERYKAPIEKLTIARLGVVVPNAILSKSLNVNYKVSILSLSYCVPVKQIDIIMKALAKYANSTSLIIEWTHIGGGELFEKLKQKASELTSSIDNLKINFVGQKHNKDVLDFLRKEQIDLFINASKSEGIPVSIMEAMAHGIPAIAPNIGGIADLVNKDNGYLMPTVCDELDFIKGINYIVDNKDKIDFTLNAYNWVKRYFNSEINYPLFINELEAIAKINEK